MTHGMDQGPRRRTEPQHLYSGTAPRWARSRTSAKNNRERKYLPLARLEGQGEPLQRKVPPIAQPQALKNLGRTGLKRNIPPSGSAGPGSIRLVSGQGNRILLGQNGRAESLPSGSTIPVQQSWPLILGRGTNKPDGGALKILANAIHLSWDPHCDPRRTEFFFFGPSRIGGEPCPSMSETP